MQTRTALLALALLISLGCYTQPGASTSLAALDVVLAELPPAADPEGELAGMQQRIATGVRPVAWLERFGAAVSEHAARSGDDALYHVVEHASRLARQWNAEPEARLLEALSLHGRHRFAEAEQAARALVEMRGLAGDHALLGDVLLDRGDLENAGSEYQRMVDLRPGAAAYLRVARLRFLLGDTEGEAEALAWAAAAAHPDPPGAWASVWSSVAFAALRANAPEAAARAAERALHVAPDDPAALHALGRARLAQGRGSDARAALEAAARALPHPALWHSLAEALRLTGEEQSAQRLQDRIAERGEARDPRATARFLADAGREPERAVALARRELLQRRDAHTRDVLAWSLHAAGRPDEAWPHAQAALASGLADPAVALHAALIAESIGESGRAADLARTVRSGRASLLPSERIAFGELEKRLSGS